MLVQCLYESLQYARADAKLDAWPVLAGVIERPSVAAPLRCPRGSCNMNGRDEDGTIRRSNKRAQRVVTPDAATDINKQQIGRGFFDGMQPSWWVCLSEYLHATL